MTFDQIAWLPLCGGITAVGIGLSYLAFRRRGVAAGVRALAWSLLPLAAYLTGIVKTLWNVGSALVSFVTGLVLSPMVWAGIALGGLSLVLFLVSGVMRGRAISRGRNGEAPKAAKPAKTSDRAPDKALDKASDKTEATPKTVESAKPAAADDFSDIEDILKRRGIS